MIIQADHTTPRIPERRPVVIRHQMAGVWIGWAMGPGWTEHLLLIHGRRIYGWSGGRLETVALARRGCTPQDRLCAVVEDSQLAIGPGDGLVEIHGTTDAIVEAALALPTAELG